MNGAAVRMTIAVMTVPLKGSSQRAADPQPSVAESLLGSRLELQREEGGLRRKRCPMTATCQTLMRMRTSEEILTGDPHRKSGMHQIIKTKVLRLHMENKRSIVAYG